MVYLETLPKERQTIIISCLFAKENNIIYCKKEKHIQNKYRYKWNIDIAQQMNYLCLVFVNKRDQYIFMWRIPLPVLVALPRLCTTD